ncbi:unnamed protein product [Amoebophrya sp. A120]|nr:unnamed protein product [Amoebophrya sp. A120]|eukprot:GSA120T00023046001.1
MSQASSCRRCRFFYIRVSLKSYLRRGVSRVIVVLRPVEEEERTFARTLQLLVLAVMLLIVEPTSFLLATRNYASVEYFVDPAVCTKKSIQEREKFHVFFECVRTRNETWSCGIGNVICAQMNQGAVHDTKDRFF